MYCLYVLFICIVYMYCLYVLFMQVIDHKNTLVVRILVISWTSKCWTTTWWSWVGYIWLECLRI